MCWTNLLKKYLQEKSDAAHVFEGQLVLGNTDCMPRCVPSTCIQTLYSEDAVRAFFFIFLPFSKPFCYRATASVRLERLFKCLSARKRASSTLTNWENHPYYIKKGKSSLAPKDSKV